MVSLALLLGLYVDGLTMLIINLLDFRCSSAISKYIDFIKVQQKVFSVLNRLWGSSTLLLSMMRMTEGVSVR